jgi:ureidoacrylate peracid hydrolase
LKPGGIEFRESHAMLVKLQTRPDEIEVDLAKSALVIVDMQNAFASKGGTLDLAGADLSEAPRVVGTIRSVLDAARAAGIAVVHVQIAYRPDLSNAGGRRSPNYYKETAMRLMGAKPELRGKLMTEGSWDAELVGDLAPRAGEIVVTKTRYSGFAGTTLDAQLRDRGIQYLFFAGIAANVCVESTLRDGYFLDYWPILLADGTMAAGGSKMYEATIFNVESFFGWTIMAEDLCASLSAPQR